MSNNQSANALLTANSSNSTAWVQLTDPETKNPIYANILTGECLWKLPPNATLNPKDSTGSEWWELYDETHNLPYYYNTTTAVTEWTKPSFGTIIPLHNIQKSTIGNRVSAMFYSSIATIDAVEASIPDLSLNPQTPNPQNPQISQTLNKNQTNSSQSINQSSKLNKTLPQINKLNSTTISQPILNQEAAIAMRNEVLAPAKQSIPKINTSSANLAEKSKWRQSKKLPDNLIVDIEKFKIIGFANLYFAEHRKGFFRRQVPVEEMLRYQNSAIKQPLMGNLNSNLKKDALKIFKLILKVMDSKSNDISTWANIQVIIDKGIRNGGLRDEIFNQICKQLTSNPSLESTIRGWRLLSVMTCVFPPSKNFENYLQHFIQQNIHETQNEIRTMSKFCSRSLTKLCKVGPKGRTLTIAEIERGWIAPFHPTVFGESLETIMEIQAARNQPDLLPKILIFLVDAILKLKGYKTEGIFRVPGDIEMVSDLKNRIESENYDLLGITDPHVPSSLLKLWLRELSEPLIPSNKYELCINVGKNENATYEETLRNAISIIESLPEINRNVIYYLINFLREIARPENQSRTKMTAVNIALVWGPNFLRCPSDDPYIIFQNTKFEQRFLATLIQGNGI